MKMYLFPEYVNLESARTFSPRFFGYLESERGLILERASWQGTLESLPTTPSIIRASSQMECDLGDLAARCAELGHLCFYNDKLLLTDGRYAPADELIRMAEQFLREISDPNAKHSLRVTRRIEQVEDGLRYKGHLIFAGKKFDYELVLATSLGEPDRWKLPQTLDDIRRDWKIMLTRDGEVIELTDEEHGLFFNFLAEAAVDFYLHPTTRAMNEGVMGAALRGKGPLVQELPVVVSIGETSIESWIFSDPKAREILSAPKFGCVFPAA